MDFSHGSTVLSLRRDVVNKTILRVMRKFYLEKIKEVSGGQLVIKRKIGNPELFLLSEKVAV